MLFKIALHDDFVLKWVYNKSSVLMYLNKVRNTNRDEAYILINNLTKFKYNT